MNSTRISSGKWVEHARRFRHVGDDVLACVTGHKGEMK